MLSIGVCLHDGLVKLSEFAEWPVRHKPKSRIVHNKFIVIYRAYIEDVVLR